MKDIRRFLIRYNIHLFFREFVLLYPVYMLLFESKGLSDLDVSLLLIIWSVSVFILEVPSGIMADRWSRKNMIVLGTAFKVGGFVIWMFAGSFFAFALGFVFWGIQEAFCSGSTEALLFDTLKENGREDDYEKYAG
ncbi:MAG: MFS transporter, partial [Clostridiales bacterium]|nr:MFS transporter [Clostridiales bacterium]